MKFKIKGILFSLFFGFFLGLIITKNIKVSLVFGVGFLFIYFFIESGEFERFLKKLRENKKREIEERRAYERKQAKLREIREEEREREIGRKEAQGEHLRREQIKERREAERRAQQKRQRDFFNNPFGIGR